MVFAGSADRYLVFNSYREGNGEIYVMDADGTNETRVTNNSIPNNFPVWSPDGSRVAVHREKVNNVQQIFVMNADGSDPDRVSGRPRPMLFLLSASGSRPPRLGSH